MRRALGILLLARTERGSQRGGGSGAEQAALWFRGGSAERGREVPVQTESLGLRRHGHGGSGPQPRRADRGKAAAPGLEPQPPSGHGPRGSPSHPGITLGLPVARRMESPSASWALRGTAENQGMEG